MIKVNDFESEILKKAIDSGMLNIATLEAQVREMEKNKYVSMHEKKIWQGKDGKWYTYIPDASASGGRRLVKKAKKDDILAAIVEHYKTEEEQPTFDKVHTLWIESKLEFGEITKETYDRYQTDYVRFFGDNDFKNLRFSEFTEDIIERFVKSTIHNKELTAKAWSGLRTILRGTFNYAKRHGYTNLSISLLLEEMAISKKAFKRVVRDDRAQVFTRTEVLELESYVEKHMSLQNLGVMLAFQTGLRCGELSALQWSDIQSDVIHVTKTEIRYRDAVTNEYVFEVRNFTKGKDGERYVVLTPDAQATLQKIRRQNPFGEYIFMNNGKRLKAQCFGKAIKSMCVNNGMAKRSIHKARKTYATNLKNHGVDDKLIQKQMGHANIATTNGYYYFDNRDFAETKEILSKCVIN